jgi:manganese/zinc/iron transport system permease protein
MLPYHDQGFWSFMITLWQRLFVFLLGGISPNDLVSEDLQLMALIISGSLGIVVGFYLIYNKMTMLANSLSHTVLLGLVVTFLCAKFVNRKLGVDDLAFYLQLIAAALTAVFTMVGLKFLMKRISQEAANALSFTGFFSCGILVTSLVFRNTHLGLEAVLGNLEAISWLDIQRLFYALALTFLVLYQLKTRMTVVSFDELFARSLGIKVGVYKNVLIFISALVLIVCFRSMGVILILSMLTAPILTARLFTSSRKTILIVALVILLIQSTFCLAIVQWLYVTFNLPVSTSGLFGFVSFLSYVLAHIVKKEGRDVIKISPKKTI